MRLLKLRLVTSKDFRRLFRTTVRSKSALKPNERVDFGASVGFFGLIHNAFPMVLRPLEWVAYSAGRI